MGGLDELDGVLVEEVDAALDVSDMVFVEKLSKESPMEPLHLSEATREEALSKLNTSEARDFSGVDFSLYEGTIDREVSQALFAFCQKLRQGANSISLAHVDLGSGTPCEQRVFELLAEQKVREAEEKLQQKKKYESSKEKDFAAAASKKRTAQAAIDAAQARLDEINTELTGLEERKVETAWYLLFTGLDAMSRNTIQRLDLTNCSLHATGLSLLTNVLLEHEHKADSEKVSWLILDGNDLGDQAMGVIASFLRLASKIQALQLRNVSITERGVSEVVAGLVANKTLALLDLRDNGLCSLETARAAIQGVQRFNKTAQILL